MDVKVREKLEAADCATGYEFPKGDWEVYLSAEYDADIKAIQKQIRLELGLSLRRDGNVQDASFWDELFVYDKEAFWGNGVIVHIVQIGIRFSNFGKLYTIHSSKEDGLTQFDLSAVRRIVDDYGWVYVPADQLQTK